MIEVAFFNEHGFPADTTALENVVSKVFLINDITIAQVGVHIVSEERMRELNENYKHHQGATDVLSFVMHDPEQPTASFLESDETQRQYGDIFLCYPVIQEEAQEEGTTTQAQLEFLLEHGCLHLLGQHHD